MFFWTMYDRFVLLLIIELRNFVFWWFRNSIDWLEFLILLDFSDLKYTEFFMLFWSAFPMLGNILTRITIKNAVTLSDFDLNCLIICGYLVWRLFSHHWGVQSHFEYFGSFQICVLKIYVYRSNKYTFSFAITSLNFNEKWLNKIN